MKDKKEELKDSLRLLQSDYGDLGIAIEFLEIELLVIAATEKL